MLFAPDQTCMRHSRPRLHDFQSGTKFVSSLHDTRMKFHIRTRISFGSKIKRNSPRNDLYCIGMECPFDRYHANNTEKCMEMEWTCSRMKVIRVSCTLVGRLGKKNDSISIWWWLECFLFLLFFFTTFGLSFLKMWKQYYWFSTLTCKITIESKAVKFTTIYSPSKVIPGQNLMFNSEH